MQRGGSVNLWVLLNHSFFNSGNHFRDLANWNMKRNQGKGSVAWRQCSAPCSHNKAGLIYSLSHGSSPAVRLHWSVCLAVVGPLTEFFLCSNSSWNANLCVHLWLAKMDPVTGSALWSLLCNPGLHCSIGLWVERAGMASGARKMRERKRAREGGCMKRTRSGFLFRACSLDDGEQRCVFTHGPVIC